MRGLKSACFEQAENACHFVHKYSASGNSYTFKGWKADFAPSLAANYNNKQALQILRIASFIIDATAIYENWPGSRNVGSHDLTSIAKAAGRNEDDRNQQVWLISCRRYQLYVIENSVNAENN